jgi:tetratricopeptide (TPR) repeat protein
MNAQVPHALPRAIALRKPVSPRGVGPLARALSVAAAFALPLWAGAALAEPAADTAPAPGSPALARYGADEAEITSLLPTYPHAVELLQRGEAVALAGQVDQALALFQRAADEYPNSGLIWRRQCEALTALGRRTEAVGSCQQALMLAPTPLTVRAAVRAQLTGAAPLSALDLTHALQIAGLERHRRPDEPWAYAALCDIGERIGDEAMLEYCSFELLRIAPNDPTTRRVLAELRSPWWVGGGWLLIALAALGTLAHAIWQLARRSRPRAGAAAVAAIALIAGVIGIAAPARAQDAAAKSAAPAGHDASAAAAATPPVGKNHNDLGDWKIDDEFPDKNIPGEGARNRDPLQFGYWLQDMTARALEASKRGEHRSAIKYLTALVRAVPDRAIGYSKLCAEYDAIGERDRAIIACSAALINQGTSLADYALYLRVMLNKPERLNDKELKALGLVIDHVRQDSGGGPTVAAEMDCNVGVKMKDADRLRQCTSVLALNEPDSPKTLAYQWSLAMVEGRYDEAKATIQRAREAEMQPEGLAKMERETIEEQSRHRMTLWLGGASALLVLAAGALGFFAWRRRSPPLQPTAQTS